MKRRRPTKPKAAKVVRKRKLKQPTRRAKSNIVVSWPDPPPTPIVAVNRTLSMMEFERWL